MAGLRVVTVLVGVGQTIFRGERNRVGSRKDKEIITIAGDEFREIISRGIITGGWICVVGISHNAVSDSVRLSVKIAVNQGGCLHFVCVVGCLEYQIVVVAMASGRFQFRDTLELLRGPVFLRQTESLQTSDVLAPWYNRHIHTVAL